MGQPFVAGMRLRWPSTVRLQLESPLRIALAAISLCECLSLLLLITWTSKRLGCLGLYKLPAHILDVKPVGFGGLVVPEPNER